MAITYSYKKGKLTHTTGTNTADVRYPATTIDNIYTFVSASSVGVSIWDSATSKIKATYITLPTLTVSDIPSLTTAKIASGTFGTSVYMPATQITGGTFTSGVILPATQISGVIKKENLPGSVDDIVELKAMQPAAPTGTGVKIGDQYFNTTNSKVCTATADGTWNGFTVDDPSTDAIYYVVPSHEGYRWSGTTMVKIALSLATTTSVRETGASDDYIPTELAVRAAINAGGVTFATQEEVYTGTEAGKVISPLTLQGKFNKHFFHLKTVAAAAPSSGMSAGDYYYNTSSNKLFTYSNSQWTEASVTGAWFFIDDSTGLVYTKDAEGFLDKIASPLGDDEIPGLVKIGSGIATAVASGDPVPSATDIAVNQADVAALTSLYQRTITVTVGYGLDWNSSTRTISLTLEAGNGITSVTGGTITADLEWLPD